MLLSFSCHNHMCQTLSLVHILNFLNSLLKLFRIKFGTLLIAHVMATHFNRMIHLDSTLRGSNLFRKTI